VETRLWPTVDHLDPPDLPRHRCNSDRGPAAIGGPTVLANDRSGGRLPLNASRHDDDDDAMLARVFATATCPSVHLSVCLSVTRWYYVKTKKVSVMISSPSGSPTILVFCCQIPSQNSKRFPRAGASKKDGVGKFSDFLALNVNISKTVADTAEVTISD